MFQPSSSDISTIELRVGELYCQAERHFLKRFPRPTITMNLRGETAGQAWTEKNLLRLNKQLFLENREHFLEHTIGHEVAHLVAHQLFGRNIRPHGKEWQFIMEQVFHLPANRTHSYNTQNASKRPFLYSCSCEGKTIPLSTIRHNRAVKGTVYLCAQCREPLTFVEQISA
ncbi:SprT family zinc-dependent metalloprotease [Endozoicomonas arenosclerae]|uniref:SprT family zinc-dependent metalloprotease n=1 Tax=Endozoicomonas arenosclerae TaxID=1633495 RepID=UPI000780E7C1|nr:SprT family zinc-dependent metalloprotease [Endozoicomonas arenosclerae]